MKLKAPLTFILLAVPFFMNSIGLASQGLFIAAILLWVTEAIPLAVTALLIPVGATWFNILSADVAFAQFSNPILFLFLGSFFLALAQEKHQLDKRMAYWLLSKKQVSKSPALIVFFVALFTWTLSMWMSNTAATAMMIPICMGISKSLSSDWTEEDKLNLEKRLLFASAFAASIGGMATPVGSPPNLLAMEFLRESGRTISFFQWMMIGIPISFSLLLALIFLLHWKFPIKAKHAKDIHHYFSNQLHELGEMKRTQYLIAMVFFLTVFLWILPDLLQLLSIEQSLSTRLPAGAVALLGAALLFILPHKQENILEWKDTQSIDWGTILIFGGGLCLGKILDTSGLSTQIGEFLFAYDFSFWKVGLLCTVLGIIVSEFSSNTAATTLLVPIIIAEFAGSNSVVTLALAATLGSSFGFMLPVSTPPNAIIFGTGKIPLRVMLKTGIFLDIIGALLIILFLFALYPFLGIV